MSKEITLTQGKKAIVDDDFQETKKYYFSHGYAVNKHVYMHREIMNAPSGMDVDHINGNTLDNRKENLRICTRSQNKMNTSRRKGNTSGYKGVCFDNTNKKWLATITINGKLKHIGLFQDAKSAAIAYDKKAKELFGDFAKLNF